MNAVATELAFDWRNPDYSAAFRDRIQLLARIRAHPEKLAALREYYRTHPWDFIKDWAVTVDARSIAKGKPALVPFIPWPKQCELIEWMYARWKAGEGGVVVKSRDVGASWCAMALLATLCIFERNFAAGVVSATEVKLDRSADPDTLFYKLREFLKNLPPEFNGGYNEEKTSAYLRIGFPATGSSITGEAGDKAGRGGRKSVVIVDESAHLERPQLIDANLSANTDCAIHMSSVNGVGNTFYEKAHNPNIARFDITWRDDPRKNFPGSTWYVEKCRTTDPIIVKQEIDCDFFSSTTGQLIPAAHINSAIGAAEKLGLAPASGAKRAGFDPADEGKDRSALAVRHGSALVHLESWPGKGSTLFKSTQRVLGTCEALGVPALDVDMDGLGAGVRGDAAAINEKRREAGKREIEVSSFRGSGAVFDPDGSLLEGVTNRDAFLNMKAMAGFALKLRFEYTHRVVEAAERGEPIEYDPDDLITIDPALPELNQLIQELSQPVYSYTAAGKRQIDKAPDGLASPNLFDAVMIAFSASRPGAYFAAAPLAAPSAEAAALPRDLDLAFAFLAFSDNAAAVIYCATNLERRGGNGALYVLDYDLREIDATLEAWLWSVAARLVELCRTPGCRFAGAQILVDPTAETGYAELIRQRGYPAIAIAEKLPPLEERFSAARPYVNLGFVRLTNTALARTVSFRSASRNFLRELASRTEVIESHALAIAFANAVLATYAGRRAIPVPPSLPAPPRPPPQPGALAPGFHIVNGIGVYVDHPGAGIPISIGEYR